MGRIVLPDVAEILEAVQGGVERRLGKRRRVYTGEDLIDDVGLSPDQFDDLIEDLEQQFAVEIDVEAPEQLSVAGALVVRLLRVCSRSPEAEAGSSAAV